MSNEIGSKAPKSEASANERPSSQLFSVIIPAYNAATVLPRSLASVSRQTFDDFEVVVVDDGSTDDTASVVEAFGNDLKIRGIQQENRGASTARNTGAAAAQGRYLLFLDADDEAEPQWLERFAEYAGHADPQVICCGLRHAQGPKSGSVRHPRHLGPAFYGYRGLFVSGTFAIPREIFKAIGGFSDGLPYGEHSELALRITRYGFETGLEIMAIDEPLIVLHHDRSAVVVASYDRARAVGASYKLDLHAEQLSRDQSILADLHAIAGVALARLGEYSAAREHLWRALSIRRHPRDLSRYALTLIPLLAKRVWFRHK